jgi:hypothetical protein
MFQPAKVCKDGCQYSKDVGLYPEHQCARVCVYFHTAPEDDIPQEQWPTVIPRVCGSSICETCGLTYDKHYKPIHKTCPSVVVLCDGRWGKT